MGIMSIRGGRVLRLMENSILNFLYVFWNISHIRYTGEAERGSRSDPSFCKGQEKYLHGVQQDQVAVNNLGCKENFASFRTF